MTDRPHRPHRDFLAIPDFTAPELEGLFTLAERMRRGAYGAKPLAGKSLAMIFMKASTRTRVSFEVGAWQLGAHALFLSPRDVQLGRGEPVADTARVLSRMVDGIMIRTYAHSEIEELALHAGVPVINGLSDQQHPCQVLADLLTVRQCLGGIAGRKVAWIGDGNNMANSWLDAAHVLGFELALACPEGYDPDPVLLERARTNGKVTLHRDARDAVAGADVVNTDVWASMGQETEWDARVSAFAGFTVDAAMMKLARPDAIFLHCLPAHRGEEVTAEVIDGPQSRVWDEAENRLHVQKAIMAVLMGGESLVVPLSEVARASGLYASAVRRVPVRRVPVPQATKPTKAAKKAKKATKETAAKTAATPTETIEESPMVETAAIAEDESKSKKKKKGKKGKKK